MRDKRTKKIAVHPYPQLEGELVLLQGDLNEVLTGNKQSTIKTLRGSLSIEKDNLSLKQLQKEKLDVAIVAYLQNSSYHRQDVDNIAKTVLDALKKPKIDDGIHYYFEDDDQIVRLLVYKKERKEDLEANTCQLSISIRKHDPTKEMNLIVKGYILNEKHIKSELLSTLE